MRGSRGCVRVSDLRPWKIQISINIVNLHIKITENTIIGTAPPPWKFTKIPSKSPPGLAHGLIETRFSQRKIKTAFTR